MTSIANLKIWRGESADSGRWEHYDVPFEPGQSVLDGLRWIRTTRDPSLAIRFSCINANACKECMICFPNCHFGTGLPQITKMFRTNVSTSNYDFPAA